MIEFAYDDAGRTVEETWLDGTNVVNTITTVYDAEGRVTNVDDASTTCAYGYDGLGRLITVDNDGTSGVPRVVLTAGYNRLDERTSLSASVAGTADFANAWLYDGLGRASRLMQTGQAGGNAVAAKRVDFGYTKFGGFGTISRHDNTAGTALVATTNHTYDGYGRLTGTSHAQGTTSLSDYTRTFDSNRRVGTAATPDGVTAYGYDAAGQLTSADHSFQADEAYSYDGTGNRTNAGYVTGTNNRLLNDGVHSYEYDPEGNRTKRTKTATGEEVLYEWDHRNRLTGVTFKDAVGVVTQDVEYVYDPQDRRIVKRLDADGNGVFESEERFVFDQGIKGGLDDAVLVFDETGVLTYRLLHGPAVDQPLTKEGANGDVLWMFADLIGTVRDLAEYAPGTGSTSVVNHLTYDSFGKITSQTNSAHIPRYGFTGREWDVDADLWWYRARWYDPSPAHFLCEDEGGRVSTANRSTYAENNPVLMIDPDGNMTLLEYLTLQRLRWWADPRTPETRVAACVVGAILARDRLTTPQEKAAWDRYTSGTGQDIILSPAEMAAWIADDAGVWSELGKLFGSCASGKSGEGSSGKSSVNVNRPPHSGSIGNTNLSISWSCSKCCLSYTITLSDRYDFDPKSLFSSPRTIKNELKTRAEYAWENFWECGWRPFHHKGIMTGTLCNS